MADDQFFWVPGCHWDAGEAAGTFGHLSSEPCGLRGKFAIGCIHWTTQRWPVGRD